jgi:hypothetical protein
VLRDELRSYQDVAAGFVKIHIVVVIVFIVVDVDGGFDIDFFFVPGADPDGVRDLEIKGQEIPLGKIEVLFDDPLSRGLLRAQGYEACQEYLYTDKHMVGI